MKILEVFRILHEKKKPYPHLFKLNAIRNEIHVIKLLQTWMSSIFKLH